MLTMEYGSPPIHKNTHMCYSQGLSPHYWEPSQEDGEEESQRNEDDGPWEDEDSSESSNEDWKEQFDNMLAQDEEEKRRKQEERGKKPAKLQTEGDCTSGKKIQQHIPANDIYRAFVPYEPEDVSSPVDRDRSPSPVSPLLGTITFFYAGQLHRAEQSPSGSVEYEGARYDNISHWMRTVFNKKI